MNDNNLKTHYSAKELVDLSLTCLPNSVQGIIYKAKKQQWRNRKRIGKGGGLEYELSSFPQTVRDEIYKRFTTQIIESKPKKLPVIRAETDLANLTDKQREIADARMGLVQYVFELEQSMSRIKAIKYLCGLAQRGELPDHLVELVQKANAKRSANRTLGVRTLNQWVVDYCKAGNVEERLKVFAPQVRQERSVESIFWLPQFLGCYRQTTGLTLAEAYRHFQNEWVSQYAENPLLLEQMPSLHQVRRAMDKLPLYVKELGRKTGSNYKNLLTYVKRDWSVLRANDVWIGDGHSLNMKVKHPINGQAFTPELTLVIDGASRMVVGWSLSLAENAFAVADAIRHGIEQHGVPAIYYSDNGGGEKNKLLDADITGILPRLGIRHETGIAGNPQGRGIIERLNKTLGHFIARQFPTYYGTGADSDSVRKTLYAVKSLAKAEKEGKELTPLQRRARGKLATWQALLDTVQDCVDWYNNQHVHRELGTTPAKKYKQLLNIDDLVMLSKIELRDMYRPQFVRKPRRGWISWNNNNYFNQQLLDVEGQDVIIGIDIHNAQWIQVRAMDGRFICDAEWNGNTREAFPVSMVEQQRKKRHDNRAKLKEQQLADIRAEANPVITIEQSPIINLVSGEIEPKETIPIFLTRAEKEAYERKQGLTK